MLNMSKTIKVYITQNKKMHNKFTLKFRYHMLNVPEKGRGFMLYDSVKEAAEMNCRSSKRNILLFY